MSHSGELHYLGPVSRKSQNFGRHNSLCIFKTKVSRATKICIYFNFYSLYKIWKDQLYRISGSEFYEWLFGIVKFSSLLRNARLVYVQTLRDTSWRLQNLPYARSITHLLLSSKTSWKSEYVDVTTTDVSRTGSLRNDLLARVSRFATGEKTCCPTRLTSNVTVLRCRQSTIGSLRSSQTKFY